MTTETKVSKRGIEKIRREIAAGRAAIERYEKEHPGEPFPFAKAKGVWKGKVHFTDADITAAKIRARDLPE
jgi:hypothetical protein